MTTPKTSKQFKMPLITSTPIRSDKKPTRDGRLFLRVCLARNHRVIDLDLERDERTWALSLRR